MKKCVVIAAFAVSLLTASCQTTNPAIQAATPMNCAVVGKTQFSEVHARAFRAFPDIKVVVLKGEKRDVFLQAFNASPPASDYTADTIHIFNSATANRRNPNQPNTSFMVMVDRNGCVSLSGEVETLYVIQWSQGKVTTPQRTSSNFQFSPTPTRQDLF